MRMKEGFTTIELPIKDRLAISKEAKKRGMKVKHFTGQVIQKGLEFFCPLRCAASNEKISIKQQNATE